MCCSNWHNSDRPDPPITVSDVIIGILLWALVLALPVAAAVKAYKNQTVTQTVQCK